VRVARTPKNRANAVLKFHSSHGHTCRLVSAYTCREYGTSLRSASDIDLAENGRLRSAKSRPMEEGAQERLEWIGVKALRSATSCAVWTV